jgi:hypothetical protein
MREPSDAWDAGLNGLIEDEIARRVDDIRASVIGEISRAISDSDALRQADPDKLAEVVVDVLIRFSRKAQAGGN